MELAFQAPDRVRVAVEVGGDEYIIGRNGEELWVHAPRKDFGLIGRTGVARFSACPDELDETVMGALALPISMGELMLASLAFQLELEGSEVVNGRDCHVLICEPGAATEEEFGLEACKLTLWIRKEDQLPARIAFEEGESTDVLIELMDLELGTAWKAERWALAPEEGDMVEVVALSHLTRFLGSLFETYTQELPTLGPVTGARRLIGTHGKGRLEEMDGTMVLYLEGTPEEMGEQHGVLMREEIHSLVERIVYGVGVGSSFDKGRWFFREVEEAQARVEPFIAERYLREMDALADAAGLHRQEMRLANFFPELFHCSGFALFGEATVDGEMYHGRILDYMKGLGLEQNAVVMVVNPDEGNAWVNCTYAGFIGSITAMNAKHVAMGEMGGRGEGDWDGKPMAQLMREVMERADTIDEAVAIMERGPRTCEYYYVVSDAKTMRAVGLATTPTRFETIWAGQSHPMLPRPFPDTVLMSGEGRYDHLADRVGEHYGKIDAEIARDLMNRPVCMTSNIQSVLFAPRTLDFWVANADSSNVASHTRYTQYNLGELLESMGTAADSSSAAGAGR
jgi:hypothetical protein